MRSTGTGPDAPGANQRPRLTILIKLLLAFAVPTMALFSVFAVVAHEVARRSLEAELGDRLAAIASAAAVQIRGKYLVELVPGDEGDRAYLNTRRKLEAIAAATDASRLYVFDRAFRSRGDTRPQVAIGTVYFQAELDRHELARVFERGEAVSSVLFEGDDGARYKAGYAPITASETEPEIALAVGVDAPAAYFSQLSALRRSLVVYGGILAVVVLAISVLVAALITRPVRRLAAAAARIGKGDLVAPVEATSRDEIGFLAETMDEMRAGLSARDERMQLMLSGIAHEVRNPLGGIALFAGILRDELGPDDERLPHVHRIERELGYLAAVVSDFLEYARRPRPERARVDAAELARDVVELIAADARAAGVTVAVSATPAPCRADAGQLRRALLNLVRNAVQAAAGSAPAGNEASSGRPAGGLGDGDGDGADVRVSVAPDASGAVIEVHNRGAPIPDEVRERIFEPFFTTREKGTGLGLAFAREIALDHGGAIDVITGAGGTTFRVSIPP